ncbi:MAG: hypothetical protein WCH79_01040, partial [Planctomycetia bacterium]
MPIDVGVEALPSPAAAGRGRTRVVGEVAGIALCVGAKFGSPWNCGSAGIVRAGTRGRMQHLGWGD